MQLRKKVLFFCTGNSCRSQMAEGWTRHLKSDCIEAYSAGIEPHGLNPFAVKVMAEAGVDISRQSSKHIYDLNVIFDYTVIVCTHATDSRTLFPGSATVTFVSFDDPPVMFAACETEEEKLNYYRRLRDQIKDFITKFPATLEK
jgi:arsenate reductase